MKLSRKWLLVIGLVLSQAQNLVGALHHRAHLGIVIIEVLAHAGVLGTLTGENIVVFHTYNLFCTAK